jgi:hypothetical protein
MSLTEPSETIVVKTTVDPLNPFGPVFGCATGQGKLTEERWHSILCKLAQLDNVDNRLMTLRYLCDGYKLKYDTIFAMVATYAPAVLWP